MRRASPLRLAGLALLWGSGFLWIKLSLRGFPPAQITLVRLALGATVLIVWLYSHSGRLPHGVKLWFHLAVAAVVANVVPYFLFALGEQQVDSSVAGMLNATTPLWTVAIAVAVGQEGRPTWGKLIGLLIGFGGTLLIFSPWRTNSQVTNIGAVACLGAALSYAISYVYMDRFLARRGLSALALSASQLLAATAVTAVVTPLIGGRHPPTWRVDALISVIVLGALGTGVAYVLNYRIIADEGASAASVVIYLLPIVAVILGAVVLREIPAINALLGVIVILAGVALTRRGVPVTGGSASK